MKDRTSINLVRKRTLILRERKMLQVCKGRKSVERETRERERECDASGRKMERSSEVTRPRIELLSLIRSSFSLSYPLSLSLSLAPSPSLTARIAHPFARDMNEITETLNGSLRARRVTTWNTLNYLRFCILLPILALIHEISIRKNINVILSIKHTFIYYTCIANFSIRYKFPYKPRSLRLPLY